MPEDDNRRRNSEQLKRAELAQQIGRNISAGVVIGALIIALAIYERPGPARFEAFAAGDEIVRIDTREGTMIACKDGQCFDVHRRGERIVQKPPQAPSVAAEPGNAALPVR